CRMLNVVLQIPVDGAGGVTQPGRDEDPDGGETLRMYVEKSEYLRLRIAEGVPDGSGFQSRFSGQFDYELHPQCPFALVVPGWHSHPPVDCLAYRSERAVAHDREAGTDVHSCDESALRFAVSIHALIRQSDADNLVSCAICILPDEWLAGRAT